MAAGTKDFLEVEQGATFEFPLGWTDEAENKVPLVGYTARMQVRATVDATDVILELTTENDRITLDTTSGSEKIHLFVDAVTMADIPAGSYKYDLEMVSGSGRVTRLIQGKFKVIAEVTR